jgi:hypothetical protein
MTGKESIMRRMKTEPFKFLTVSEFEALNPEEKRVYISEATAEQERTKLDPAAGGWDKLFRQDRPQTQQQQQPQPKDDKKPD